MSNRPQDYLNRGLELNHVPTNVRAGAWCRGDCPFVPAKKTEHGIVFCAKVPSTAMPTKNNKSNAKYTAPADSSSSTDGDKKGKNIGVRVKVRHVMCAKVRPLFCSS